MGKVVTPTHKEAQDKTMKHTIDYIIVSSH